MKHFQPYLLSLLLLGSVLAFTGLGYYWNETYYHEELTLSADAPMLATAMQGIHDGLLEEPARELSLLLASCAGQTGQTARSSVGSYYAAIQKERQTAADTFFTKNKIETSTQIAEVQTPLEESVSPLSFTTASDDYFADAVFIGDSRTVGISKYAGIEDATFLCQTSLSIYDFEKKEITYNGRKTSVKAVLSERQFGKVYLMVGINECGRGTPQSFYEEYERVVEEIRALQPDALIFLEGNLFVTQAKSDSEQTITNPNIAARNDLIATLANWQDIFYIDINESCLCAEGSLVDDYTWDQVHIKAQYYDIWREFLLEHAIVERTTI